LSRIPCAQQQSLTAKDAINTSCLICAGLYINN
jgi:hypothetical protein